MGGSRPDEDVIAKILEMPNAFQNHAHVQKIRVGLLGGEAMLAWS